MELGIKLLLLLTSLVRWPTDRSPHGIENANGHPGQFEMTAKLTPCDSVETKGDLSIKLCMSILVSFSHFGQRFVKVQFQFLRWMYATHLVVDLAHQCVAKHSFVFQSAAARWNVTRDAQLSSPRE